MISSSTPVSNTTQLVRPTPNRADPQKILEAVEASNVPIEFWGKVVDQDDKPLDEVRIEYDYAIEHGNLLGVAWSDQERRTGKALTDRDGLFSIRGLKGHRLSILSLNKESYQFRSKEVLIFDFYGSNPSGKFIPNQQKPVTFTLVHKDQVEPLVQSRGSLRVDGVGTSERWNLWTGEAGPDGELAVTLKAALPGGLSSSARWSAKLQIIGGGIIEASWSEDVRRAPESGYLADVDYPEKEQKQGYRIGRFM